MKQWRLNQLIFCHLSVLLLIASFLWPVTRHFWEILDVAFFKLINQTLKGNKLWQVFWASANHRWADWVEDFFILGFFTFYVRSLEKGQRLKGVAQLLFSALYIAAILYFVNKTIFRENFVIHRNSPTLVVEDSVRLSQEIPWMKIKDDSTKCFPADHATTAILFAATYTFFAGRRLGLLAILYAVFLCMPRMITGAHWLSDILVGSGSIVLLLLSWAFCTPFHLWCIRGLERFLKFFTFFRKSRKIGI